MVLLALPPAVERDRGQFVPSRRRRMMANVGAERLLKIPPEPSPELRIPGAAAQTRVVSMAGIRLGSWESARSFKGIICVDISEFESHMPSHAVGSLWRVYLRAAPFALNGVNRLQRYVLVTEGRLPTNLGKLLDAMRQIVGDVTEDEVRKSIAWALRQMPLRDPRQTRRPRPRLRLVQ